jgi:murein DD-endopeptidase MepM/ murein hydrolase activator NlpD
VIRRVTLACAFLLVAGLAAGAVPSRVAAHPNTQEEIEQRIEQLRRLRLQLDARERDVRDDISNADKRRSVLTGELAELQAVVDEVQSRVDEASAVLGGIQSRLDRKSAELRRTERALELRMGELRDRAVQVYKHGPASLLDMLLGSEGFGEFMRRFGFMVQIVQTDNERIAEIREMRASIIRERDVISQLRNRAAQQMSVVAHERDHASQIAKSVDTERRAVSGEIQQQYAQLGDIQQQKEAYEQETAELQAESMRIAAFLRGTSSGEATVSPRGMIWPTNGPVTSGYGWRTHPIFGTRRFHAGIDIGAPGGSPVSAAATGRVVYAGSATGYGRHVIIDHGGGIATLYGHLSSISSGQGTVLARGGSVGAVGCTGYCTGPHLHFEVRVNGDPDNPMRWLP